DADCQRLAHGTGGIFKSNVLRRDIVCIDHRRRCAKGGDWLAVQANHVRMKIESENGLLGIFANQMKETLFTLNVDQLFVDAGLDVNYNRFRGAAGRNGHDCVLDRLELASAIERDDDVNMIRSSLGVTARERNRSGHYD